MAIRVSKHNQHKNKSNLNIVKLFLEKKYYPQAVNQKSVSDGEKREKLIVIKKLEGLEKELKVDKDILDFIEKKFPFKFNICFQLLAYSESLTDQVAIYHLIRKRPFTIKISRS